MVNVTIYNKAEEILASKTVKELVKAWEETDQMIAALKFNPTGQERDAQWDAVIQARQWITRSLQSKLPYEEFCKVVGI
jgi:hypothetical protein